MLRNSGNPIRFSWTWNKKSNFAKVFCCFPNTGLKHCSTMCSLKLPFQVGLGSVDSVYEKKTTHFKCSLHWPHRDLLWTSQLLSEIPNNDHKRQNCSALCVGTPTWDIHGINVGLPSPHSPTSHLHLPTVGSLAGKTKKWYSQRSCLEEKQKMSHYKLLVSSQLFFQCLI